MASAPMTPAPDLLDTSAAGPKAIRGGALRVGSYVVGTLAGVGSAALLFRHLHDVDAGRYSVAIALVSIVAGVSDLGLTAVGVRELSVLRGEARNAVARNLLGLRFALSVAGTVLITAFAAAAGYGATLTFGVALAGVGLVLQGLQSALAMSLISDLRLAWVALFEGMRAVLGAALIVVLVLAGAHLLAFLTVTIPVGIVVLALNAWTVRGRIPLRPAFSGSAWWGLLRNVLPYSAAVAAGTLYIYMAVVIVSLLANKHAIGYFGVSSRVIQVLLALPQILIGAAFPIFARAARDDRVRLAYAVGRVFEASLLFGVLISLNLAIGASIVIDVVGGSEYAPAAGILAIQGVGVAASFAGAVWSNGLLSLGRYRDILAINIVALLVGGVLIALLVSIDGAHGAAIATAADELMLALLSGYALARADRSLTPTLRILPPVVLAAGLAAASTLLTLPVLVSVTLASVIYLVTLVVTGAIPQELREQIRRRPHVHS